jgi:hypothetical protein
MSVERLAAELIRSEGAESSVTNCKCSHETCRFETPNFRSKKDLYWCDWREPRAGEESIVES